MTASECSCAARRYPYNLSFGEKWVSLDMRYMVVLLAWLSGVTSSDAGTLTSKLRLAQESREQCTRVRTH